MTVPTSLPNPQPMTRLRQLIHDVNLLTTWLLAASTLAAIMTGFIVLFWGLHGFTWHTYAGYAMTVTAAVHVVLNGKALMKYTRGRARTLLSRSEVPTNSAGRPVSVPAPEPVPAGAGATAKRIMLSRRGLAGIALGGGAGYFIGQGVRPTVPLEYGSDLGVIYHRWSSDPGIIDSVGALANRGTQPPLYKSYPADSMRPLPAATRAGGMALADALEQRRSIRNYTARPLTAEELSLLLALSSGRHDDSRRTHPSAGGLYPVETYVVVHNVEDLEPGIYHYGPEHHDLHLVRTGDFRADVVRFGLNQEFLGEGSVTIYYTLILQRLRFRYAERSYRYGVLEVGHLGQSLYLAATAMGLGACAVGAYDDGNIDRLLGLNDEEISVYLLSVGPV